MQPLPVMLEQNKPVHCYIKILIENVVFAKKNFISLLELYTETGFKVFFHYQHTYVELLNIYFCWNNFIKNLCIFTLECKKKLSREQLLLLQEIGIVTNMINTAERYNSFQFLTLNEFTYLFTLFVWGVSASSAM